MHPFVFVLVLSMYGGALACGFTITHRQRRSALPLTSTATGPQIGAPSPEWSADTLVTVDHAVDHVADHRHGAEYFAAELEVNPEKFREDTQEIAAEIWRRHHERQLAETNKLFDALMAGMEGWDQPVTADAYPGQRPVSSLPIDQSPTMRAMATFSPETMIAVITSENERPTVFSWTTAEYPLQGSHRDDREVQVAEVVNEWSQAGMLPATQILVRDKPERADHVGQHASTVGTQGHQVRRHRRSSLVKLPGRRPNRR